jgi:hypothetical protein
MQDYYYGCTPALAWILGHYFYQRKHFVWLASEYYPYRLPNPKSSNPHLIYQDLYQPWKDKDDFDKFIQQLRLNLRKGVQAKAKEVPPSLSVNLADLKYICDHVDIVFLYPIIYRVDINVIPARRRTVAGSGATAASSEYLVKDLDEGEFKLLFLDFDTDPEFKRLVTDEYYRVPGISPVDPIKTLRARC